MNLFPHDDEAGTGLMYEIQALVWRVAQVAAEHEAASRIAAAAIAVQAMVARQADKPEPVAVHAMAGEAARTERQAITDTDDFLARIQADRQKDRP